MTDKTEFGKDLLATQLRNSEPVTITLTVLEVYAVVNTIRFAEKFISKISPMSPMNECAQYVANKMHDCLDSNSLLSQQLNESWGGEVSNNFSSGNFPPESSSLEGFIDNG